MEHYCTKEEIISSIQETLREIKQSIIGLRDDNQNMIDRLDKRINGTFDSFRIHINESVEQRAKVAKHEAQMSSLAVIIDNNTKTLEKVDNMLLGKISNYDSDKQQYEQGWQWAGKKAMDNNILHIKTLESIVRYKIQILGVILGFLLLSILVKFRIEGWSEWVKMLLPK